MLDLKNNQHRIEIVDQEDRAMQRCNPSAWPMPEDEQEHILNHMLLTSCPSFGQKAINLLIWRMALNEITITRMRTAVGHMSVLYRRRT